MSYNRITVIGNVGMDAEVSDYDSRYLIRFNVCTTNRFKKGEEWVNESQWFNVQMWTTSSGQARLLTKGATVLVEGSMRSKEYEKDGEKRLYWYIAASSFQILSGTKKNDADTAEPKPNKDKGKPKSDAPKAPKNEKPAQGERKINPEDIPF